MFAWGITPEVLSPFCAVQASRGESFGRCNDNTLLVLQVEERRRQEEVVWGGGYRRTAGAVEDDARGRPKEVRRRGHYWKKMDIKRETSTRRLTQLV